MYQNCPKQKGEFQVASLNGYDAILRHGKVVVYKNDAVVRIEGAYDFKKPLSLWLSEYVKGA